MYYNVVSASNTSILIESGGGIGLIPAGVFANNCGSYAQIKDKVGQAYLPQARCAANQTGQAGVCNFQYSITATCVSFSPSMLALSSSSSSTGSSGSPNATVRIHAGSDAAWLVLMLVMLLVKQL